MSMQIVRSLAGLKSQAKPKFIANMTQGTTPNPDSGSSRTDNDIGERTGQSAADATAMHSSPHSSLKKTRRLWLLIVVATTAAGLAWQFGDYLKLEYLATQENQLRAFQQQYPAFALSAACLIYVFVTGLSLPGAAPLTLLYGWYFGFAPTLILVSFSSTAGATIAFLTSRYLLRGSIEQKFGDRLQNFNKHLESEGPFYLFTLRLIPVVPFFVINLVMGLTPLSVRTYWWVSQLGMLPGTAVYVYAGSSVPHLTQLAEEGAAAALTPQQLFNLFIAFILLGTFPLLVKLCMKWIGRGKTHANT